MEKIIYPTKKEEITVRRKTLDEIKVERSFSINGFYRKIFSIMNGEMHCTEGKSESLIS